MTANNSVKAYGTIIVLCVAIYFKSLFYGITNCDDEVLISGNLPSLRDLANILTVFTTDAFYQVKSIDLYRPLQSASFIVDAQWGLDPVAVAHLTNLILHTLTCLTLFNLLKLLDFREKIAFLGALVYAGHYLFMTAVVWLPARGDLLLALFSLLALTSFIRILARGGWQNYLLHGIFFTLAIFSKESGVVLPLILALYLWAYGRAGALRRVHLLLPLFYLAIQCIYFRLKSMAVVLYPGDTGLIPLLKNIRTLPETVAKFYLPLNLSTLPEYQTHATGAGVLFIIGLALLYYRYRSRVGRRPLFYGGWFLLFMVPGLIYFPAFYSFAHEHTDHRAYITCFGLLLLNLHLVQLGELDRKRYFQAVSLLLLVYLAACNLYFSGNYRNPATFALQAIRSGSSSALAYANYGVEKLLQGEDLEALRYLNRSLQIFDKYMPALHHRARIYRARGMNSAALADLDKLLVLDPSYDAADYALRGTIKLDLRDYSGARSDFTAALQLDPQQPEATKALATLLRMEVR